MTSLQELLDRPDVADHLRGIAAAPAKFGAYAGLGRAAPDGPQADLAEWAAAESRRYGDTVEQAGAAAARLASLRAELARRELGGFIVPMTDEYFGEYLPRRAQRLTWLTGFTGSAGTAIVLADRAAIWTDGRYTLQLRDQADAALFSLHHISDEPPTAWLRQNLKRGAKFAYDPRLHTVDGVAQLKAACDAAGALLVPVETNPLDAVWTDQPPPPLAPAEAHDVKYAGESSAAKRERLAAELNKQGIDAAVLSLPESLAWLLNLRGGDVPHTPLTLAQGILFKDGTVELFIDARKLDGAVRAHLGNAVIVRAPDEFAQALVALGKAKKTVLVDAGASAAQVFNLLGDAGATIKRGDDPTMLAKACKNAVELAGMRGAHRRDGAAVTRFLHWLSQQAPGTIDELQAAAKLQEFRRGDPLIRDLSFSTITGSGPNGAIVHYRSTPRTNRRLQAGELYLVDSGAQYLDGTTDITRTVAVGQPSAEMRDRFTRVLKGHIALGSARFPVGTTGSQLDVLARVALWQAGLDYDHGTGHGVGAYLGVHEGPHRISKIANSVALRPGMVVSNEPGYYKTGAYGIRIENLVAVRDASGLPAAEKKMLEFETLTRAPIDRDVIDLTLLTPAEIAWLDAYHAEVRADLTPLLNADTAAWLADVTRPLG